MLNRNGDAGTNLAVRNGLYCIYINKGAEIIFMKHASFDDTVYPLQEHKSHKTFDNILRPGNGVEEDAKPGDKEDEAAALSRNNPPTM